MGKLTHPPQLKAPAQSRGLNYSIIAALYLFSLPVLMGSLIRISDVLAGQGDDPRYLRHPWLTALHLMPGILFFLVGPLQFLPRKAAAHRFLGRVFVVSGVCSGIGVMAMVYMFPALGGLLTQIVTTLIIMTMSAMMIGAVLAIRRKNRVLHRALMLRAYALGLSVATARWVLMAAAALNWSFQEGFVIASAIGVALNVSSVETWLRREARRA